MSGLAYMSEVGMPPMLPTITEDRTRSGYVFRDGAIVCPFVQDGVCKLLGQQCLFVREWQELGVRRTANGSLNKYPCTALRAWYDPEQKWRGRGFINA